MRTLVGIFLGIGLTFGLSGVARSSEFDGAFVASFSDAAILLDLVQSSEGQIVGRYEVVRVKEDGQITTINTDVSGTASASRLVIAIRGNGLLSGELSLSGDYDQGRLSLRGGDVSTSFSLVLSKADLRAFQGLVDELTERAAVLEGALNQQATLEKAKSFALEIDRHTERVAKFIANAEPWLAALSKAEHEIMGITSNMQATQTRQARTMDEQGRSALATAIGNAQMQSGTIYYAVEIAVGQLEGAVSSLAKDASRFSGICGEVPNVEDVPENVGAKQLVIDSCDKFHSQSDLLAQHIQELRAAIDEMAARWKKEETLQQEIVRTAEGSV